jgi:type II secretion system protein J
MLHNDGSPRAKQNGFTLIEVLLALAMFATLCGVIFASFAAVSDGVEKGRQSADVYRVGRAAMQHITQEMSSAIWYKDDPRTTFISENNELGEHAADRVRFVTIPYRRFTEKRPEGELCDVAYFLDKNAQDNIALFRTEDCTLDNDREEGGSKLEMSDLVVGLDITAYDATGEHDTWPPGGGDEGPLPCYVRVALTLRDAQQYERVFITTTPLLMRGKCEDETP